MGKLHELLAVEGNYSTQSDKLRTELTATFTHKRHLFEKKLTTFQPLAEGAPTTVEAQSEIQSTVAQEVKWFGDMFVKAVDIAHQIDVANLTAKSDVLDEDGTVIIAGIPATSLLQLEKRIREVQVLAQAIPTLDPAKGFTEDKNAGKGIYQARPVTGKRTKKVPKVLVKYEATKEHPAQTEVYHEDEPIGTLQQQEWSSMLTPALKSDILDRCDRLIRAIRKARAKANDTETSQGNNKIGKELLDYMFKPIA